MKVADRGGLTRLDYTQNEIDNAGRPFSVRPAAGAAVSVLIARTSSMIPHSPRTGGR